MIDINTMKDLSEEIIRQGQASSSLNLKASAWVVERDLTEQGVRGKETWRPMEMA